MRIMCCAMISPKGAFGLDGEPIEGPYEKGSVIVTHRRACSLIVFEQVLGN